jgi:uncharacterized protein
MYLGRKLDQDLQRWYRSRNRKPLVLQGARQTGKSTSVRQFGKTAPLYVELNLERFDDLRLTRNVSGPEELLQAIKSRTNVSTLPTGTVIFIDEIQENLATIPWLRFFHEDHPELAVIVAGSYLGIRMGRAGFSFPVGRVTFRRLAPLSYFEFADAHERQVLAKQLLDGFHGKKAPPEAVHLQALELLKSYVSVGGMPEAVSAYLETGNPEAAKTVHKDLRQALAEDIQKYPGDTRAIEEVFEHMREAYGLRFKNERLVPNQSGVKTGEALKTLAGAMLVHLVSPTVSLQAPLVISSRIARKLVPLDIGMALSDFGLSGGGLQQASLEDTLGGRFAECLVGQQLLSNPTHSPRNLCYWVRQKRKSDAEVDFLLETADGFLPVEVKSGATGTLRSLHQLLLRSGLRRAVRLYSGQLDARTLTVDMGDDKLEYLLTSLPLYMAELLVDPP